MHIPSGTCQFHAGAKCTLVHHPPTCACLVGSLTGGHWPLPAFSVRSFQLRLPFHRTVLLAYKPACCQALLALFELPACLRSCLPAAGGADHFFWLPGDRGQCTLPEPLFDIGIKVVHFGLARRTPAWQHFLTNPNACFLPGRDIVAAPYGRYGLHPANATSLYRVGALGCWTAGCCGCWVGASTWATGRGCSIHPAPVCHPHPPTGDGPVCGDVVMRERVGAPAASAADEEGDQRRQGLSLLAHAVLAAGPCPRHYVAIPASHLPCRAVPTPPRHGPTGSGGQPGPRPRP